MWVFNSFVGYVVIQFVWLCGYSIRLLVMWLFNSFVGYVFIQFVFRLCGYSIHFSVMWLFNSLVGYVAIHFICWLCVYPFHLSVIWLFNSFARYMVIQFVCWLYGIMPSFFLCEVRWHDCNKNSAVYFHVPPDNLQILQAVNNTAVRQLTFQHFICRMLICRMLVRSVALSTRTLLSSDLVQGDASAPANNGGIELSLSLCSIISASIM